MATNRITVTNRFARVSTIISVNGPGDPATAPSSHSEPLVTPRPTAKIARLVGYL